MIEGFNLINDTSNKEGLDRFIPIQDKKYFLDIKLSNIIHKSIEHNLRTIVYGPHGSGKSTHIEQVAAKLKLPCIRANLDSNITRGELIGKDIIEIKNDKQVVVFKHGLLPWALQNGLILILDEYDSARPETLFILQKILEKDGKLFLFEENSEITPHPNFRIFATANTIGSGDEGGYYAGTQIINQSNLDRWDIIAKSHYLDELTEVKLINTYFPTMLPNYGELHVNGIVKMANLIRNSFAQSDISVTFSTRTLFAFCKNIEIFNNYELAFELSYLNRLSDPEEQMMAKELFQRCFG